MNAQAMRTLYEYNYWATDRILGAAAGVPAEDFAAASLGYARLRQTLAHTLGAEWIWRSRWQGVSPAAMLDASEFATLDALRARWDDERRQMEAFLDTLGDADLGRVVEYTTTGGQHYANTLWHLMVHLVNHGTQHRSELALLLTELGRSPGDIDMITFVREKGL
jgi:uncharacterized damage-inducible protein DinB